MAIEVRAIHLYLLRLQRRRHPHHCRWRGGQLLNALTSPHHHWCLARWLIETAPGSGAELVLKEVRSIRGDRNEIFLAVIPNGNWISVFFIIKQFLVDFHGLNPQNSIIQGGPCFPVESLITQGPLTSKWYSQASNPWVCPWPLFLPSSLLIFLAHQNEQVVMVTFKFHLQLLQKVPLISKFI